MAASRQKINTASDYLFGVSIDDRLIQENRYSVCEADGGGQMPQRKKATRSAKRLGKQPPQYRFFLNPYTDARFTSCPQCGGKTRVRKLPLVIHVDQGATLALNKTCKFCPYCDLLIAHQDELEALLAAYFGQHFPDVVGNDYLVIGTEDRDAWRRGMRTSLSPQEMLEHLHDFRDYVTFSPQRWGWVPPPASTDGSGK